MSSQFTIYDHDIDALTEPTGLLCALKGVDFEDIRIPRADWSTYSNKAEFPWGTLPVLLEGALKLGKAGAIQRYLARKFGVAGANEFEQPKCDEIIEATTELRDAFCKASFAEDDKKEAMMKNWTEEICPQFCKVLDEILMVNCGFCVGKQVSYTDLIVASLFDQLSQIYPDILKSYNNIKAHLENILELPGIKEWVIKRQPALKL